MAKLQYGLFTYFIYSVDKLEPKRAQQGTQFSFIHSLNK